MPNEIPSHVLEAMNAALDGLLLSPVPCESLNKMVEGFVLSTATPVGILKGADDFFFGESCISFEANANPGHQWTASLNPSTYSSAGNIGEFALAHLSEDCDGPMRIRTHPLTLVDPSIPVSEQFKIAQEVHESFWISLDAAAEKIGCLRWFLQDEVYPAPER